MRHTYLCFPSLLESTVYSRINWNSLLIWSTDDYSNPTLTAWHFFLPKIWDNLAQNMQIPRIPPTGCSSVFKIATLVRYFVDDVVQIFSQERDGTIAP